MADDIGDFGSKPDKKLWQQEYKLKNILTMPVYGFNSGIIILLYNELYSYLSTFRHTLSSTSYNRMGTSKKTKYRSNQEDFVIYEPRNFCC